MIELKSIDHVCLWVSSLKKSKIYYEKLFNIECLPREGDETTLVVESKSVHFFISENNGNTEFLNKQHLSFEVECLNDVTQHLKSLNISYSTGKVDFFKSRNYKWCEWRDCDGIRLECIETI